MGNVYQPRTYRELFSAADILYFRCAVKETDLQVGIGLSCSGGEAEPGVGPGQCGCVRGEIDINSLRDRATRAVLHARQEIEGYIPTHPEFLTSLVPVIPWPWAPPTVRWMCAVAARAGVGPMAAVAGAISEAVGVAFLSGDASESDGCQGQACEVIVENGGDVFIASSRLRRVGVYAGTSPISGKVALEIAPSQTPCGVCTSSGTVGHSRSFGKCDAAVIVAEDTALADAVATRVANEVRSPEDIEGALDIASGIPGVMGAVVVVGDALGAWGDIALAPA